MTTKTPNLATVVHESEEAARKAAELHAKATAAQRAAEEARQAVEREHQLAHVAYLQLLEAEHPKARQAALNAQVAARAALEDAVAGESDGNVFRCYRAWIQASVRLWEVDAALQSQRYFLGRPSRETRPPSFAFGTDIAQIIDHLSLTAQDDAQDRIAQRRARFLSGQEA